jgi:transcription-repair coupling factor (superfamily II helicase)
MPLYAPPPAQNEGAGASLSVPWRLVSLGLVVLTVASLAALVTVASINDADELSTVALALAVLAFAAQLVISLAQAQAATRQEAENRRIASDTQAALAEIRATTAGLMSTVGTQYDRVLEAALRALPTAVAQQAEDGVVIDREALRIQIGQEIEQQFRREVRRGEESVRAHLDMKAQPAAEAGRRAVTAKFQFGDEVVHKKWGIGQVLEVDSRRGEALIHFPGVGEKLLDLAIAPIERRTPPQTTRPADGSEVPPGPS